MILFPLSCIVLQGSLLFENMSIFQSREKCHQSDCKFRYKFKNTYIYKIFVNLALLLLVHVFFLTEFTKYMSIYMG